MDLIDRLSTGWKAWLVLFSITFIAAAPGVFFLPALDRDESRFAQSSKQFLETGDYVVLRYQGEYRNKKPAGIHWLQAGATALLGDGEWLDVWTYRVPGWIGASLSVLAVFWAGIALVGRRAAFVGAALYGATTLLTSEAHIAKTDGMLALFVALALGALAKLYMCDDRSRKMALLFWVATGLGFLIKGPVIMLVAALTGLGTWVWARADTGRGGAWWRPLVFWPGPALCVVLVLPWFVWVQLATDGDYLRGALGKDLKDKFAGASEGHAGWPFYHLSLLPVWFFPAVILLVPGVGAACKYLHQQAGAGTRHAVAICTVLAVLSAFATWLLPGAIGSAVPMFYPALLIAAFGALSMWPGRMPHADWAQQGKQNTPGRHDMPDRPCGSGLREAAALRFLLASAVLTTVFFELMPTRLGHYILPAYPAFALLGGWGVDRLAAGMRSPVLRLPGLVPYMAGGGLLLLVGTPFVFDMLKREAAGDFSETAMDAVMQQWAPYGDFPLWLWVAGVCTLVHSCVAFVSGRFNLALVSAVLTSLLVGWHLRMHVLPTQIWLQPTESARLALDRVCGIPNRPCSDGRQPPRRILALGYAEPSYVLTLGTQNLHSPETPLYLPVSDGAYPVVYLVNMEDEKSRSYMDDITGQARKQGRCLLVSDPVDPVHAVNYSSGDPVSFRAFRFEATACPDKT